MRPVGFVRSPRREPIDDDWGSVESVIELEDAFGPEALQGLADFSHVEVVYSFHLVPDDAVSVGARRPRGNPAWPEVGIFAQRGKDRPNRIGVSVCSVVSVSGTAVRVRGLDAIDGSPVLDLKPYLRQFAPRGPVRQPGWVDELMAEYW